MLDEGLGDLGQQFGGFCGHGLKIGIARRYCESNKTATDSGTPFPGQECSSDALSRS
jgi:hypothetical protein